MKTTGMTLMMTGMVTMLSSSVWAGAKPAAKATLTICFGGSEDATLESRAEAVASDIFAKIGVRLQWQGVRKCPQNAIRVDLAKNTPADQRPGALAYALPYEGTHIVVFFDRVKSTVGPSIVPYLLGHVIAHEVTHILQGEVRHSATGVMKETWKAEDYRQMAWEPLGFTSGDILLIEVGLRVRADVLARGQVTADVPAHSGQ